MEKKALQYSGNESVWFAVNNSLNVSVEGIIFVTNISCHYQYAFQFHNVSGLVFSDTSYNSSYGGYVSVNHDHNYFMLSDTIYTFVSVFVVGSYSAVKQTSQVVFNRSLRLLI